MVIGRGGDVDVQVLNRGVSREHAAVTLRSDGSVTVADLGSRNGTWVNGNQITTTTIKTGDVIRVGEVDLALEELDADLHSDAEIATEEINLRLLSGPALEGTIASVRARRRSSPAASFEQTAAFTPTPAPCLDPLHKAAKEKGWKYCPACAQPPT